MALSALFCSWGIASIIGYTFYMLESPRRMQYLVFIHLCNSCCCSWYTDLAYVVRLISYGVNTRFSLYSWHTGLLSRKSGFDFLSRCANQNVPSSNIPQGMILAYQIIAKLYLGCVLAYENHGQTKLRLRFGTWNRRLFIVYLGHGLASGIW